MSDIDFKIVLGIIFIFAVAFIGVIIMGVINQAEQDRIDRINNCNHSCEAMDYKYSRIKFNKDINLKYPDKYNCYCIYNQSIIKIW